MLIKDEITDERLHYDIKREPAKMSALLSSKINKMNIL